jgi:hypothetical protein
MAEQAPAYIYLAFVFAYGTQILHTSRDFLLTSLIAAGIVSFATIPLAGHLSDLVGRKLVRAARPDVRSAGGADRRMLYAAPALQRRLDRLSVVVGDIRRPGPIDRDRTARGLGSGYVIAGYVLFCAIVSIVSTAMLPDYTNKDISEEHA